MRTRIGFAIPACVGLKKNNSLRNVVGAGAFIDLLDVYFISSVAAATGVSSGYHTSLSFTSCTSMVIGIFLENFGISFKRLARFDSVPKFLVALSRLEAVL